MSVSCLFSSPLRGRCHAKHSGGGSLHLRTRARQLGKSLTPEEAKLWVQLKHLNRRGHHFRRQVPVDGYILDFAEFRQKLIIKVDGSQHAEAEHEKHDVVRDQHFIASGFIVLRF